MPLNAGRRFQQMCNELESRGITRKEIADQMGVRYTTLATYYNMKEFSQTILTKRIPVLTKYGVNVQYFEEPDAQMWVKEEQPGDDELIKGLIVRIAENSEETKKAVSNITALIEEVKDLRKEVKQKDTLILQQHETITKLLQQQSQKT